MAEQDSGLFAIEVDADDYAEAAAGDTPAVDRTYQSDADFQAIKATYFAKIDGGKKFQDLINAVPMLDPKSTSSVNNLQSTNGQDKVKLSKKDCQLLGYAVGELYYDKDYAGVTDLCRRVQARCDFDLKTKEALGRWIQRSEKRAS
jgi:hypothetical protein